MNKRVASLAVALLLALAVPLVARADTPLDTVKANVDSVLEVLRNPKLQGEAGKKVKTQRIQAAADKLFDFVELSKRTLGMAWNKFTPDQRKEFVRLFESVLRDTYVGRITAYTNEQVSFTKEASLSSDTAEVRSVVTGGKSGEVHIDYRVIKKDDQWKVYDVVIEGVSLIDNYRSQFREILAKGTPETLLDTLRKKVGSQ